MLRQPRLAEHGGVAVTVAASRRIGSDSIRRATKASTSAVGRSSQWASSTTSRSPLGGDVREQVERGHGDPEGLGRGVLRQAERGVERGALDVAELAARSRTGRSS